jgi:hypothetical protein
VRERVRSLPLNMAMGLSDLEDVFRDVLPGILRDARPAEFMFVANANIDLSRELNPEEAQALVRLTAEARDVAEQSTDVARVVAECADAGVAAVLDHVAENLDFRVSSSSSPPLAKVVPVLSKFVQEGKDGHYRRSSFFLALCSNAAAKQFSGNVYEAFCSDADKVDAAGQEQDFLGGMQRFIQRLV